MNELVAWTRKQLKSGQVGSLPNGWVILKGGDLHDELLQFGRSVEVHPIKKIIDLPYFEGKSIVYLPRQSLGK
jgi:16S rRNA (guanine527-N7)-methyltransferase